MSDFPSPEETTSKLDINDLDVKSSQITQPDSDLLSDPTSADSVQPITLQDRIFQAFKQLKTSLAVGFIATALGAAGATVALNQTFNLNIGPSINIKDSPISGDPNIEIVIYESDPPEVRQRKISQANALIVDKTLKNLSHLDSRLNIIDATFDIVKTEPLLPGIRQGVASRLAN